LVGIVIYVLLKYALPLLTPFVFGVLIAYMLRPLTDLLARVTRLKQKTVALIILVLFYASVGTLMFLAGIRIVGMIGNFFSMIPDYYSSEIAPYVNAFFNNITDFFNELDPSLRSTIQGLTGSITSALASLVSSLSTAGISMVTGLFSSVPMTLVKSAIVIISSFFVSADLPGIRRFVLAQIQPRHMRIIRMIKENAFGVIGNYGKAYLILMTLTFTEMLVGLWLIGVRNAALIALAIALFDILPVLGIGGILIPWAVVHIVTGNVPQGIKLLVLYGIATAVRQTMEPRIVGMQIGLHPLVTLICMYIGAMLFGIVGMLGLPITATIIKNLNENGTLKLYVNL
jgi:sporulation integral membrane protein YtvI